MASYSDLRAEVFRHLAQQQSSDNELLTTTIVNAAIAEAYRWLARETSCLTRSVTIATVVGQRLYSLPIDVVTVEQMYYSTDTSPLPRTTRDKLARKDDGWRAASNATPSYWYPEGGLNFGLYAPPAAIVNLTLNIICMPTSTAASGLYTSRIAALSGDSDVPAVPEPYHEAIAYYAAFKLATTMLLNDPHAQQVAPALIQHAERLKTGLQVMVAEG